MWTADETYIQYFNSWLQYMYMYFTKLLKKNNIKNYKGMAISFF